MRLRHACVGDAAALTRLALQAKAHWGYTAAQIDAWRDELTVRPESITTEPTFVAELDGEIAGFCQLAMGSEPVTLEHFWVRPASMRRGVGRALLRHALEHLAAAGRRELGIDADPNAEAFYLAAGARRIAAVAAPVDGEPDRVRPQLRIAIDGA